MQFRKKDTVIFFGDSITACNKTNHEGASAKDVLGSGYVNMMNSHYLLYNPKLKLRIINQGISGNRSVDLIERLEKDVLSNKPNHVFLMIGINDAWRTLDNMQIPRFQTTLKDYQNNIDQLVKTMLNHSINVILMSPFHLEPNRNDDLRKAVDSYNVFLKQYAKQHNLLFIDLQSAFDELLTQTSVYVLSQDRIHVNMAGHMFIKDTILKHIG